MKHFTEKTAHGEVNQKNKLKVFVDSDAFVGWVYKADPHHERASHIFHQLSDANVSLLTTSQVVAETATVLSHRSGQQLAKIFLEIVDEGEIPVVHISADLLGEAFALFKEQNQRGTSVTDCANVVVMRHYLISTIFSFDKFYPKKFELALAEELVKIIDHEHD